MADIERGQGSIQSRRPLSPHLQIYRPELTSITSILTRITGLALLVPGIAIVWWFLAAATGPAEFARANSWLTSWFGDLVLSLSVLAAWYHLLAGLRHVWWDNTASMMDIPSFTRLTYVMLALTVALTLLTLLIV